jgi:hypothetical protein
MSHIGGGVKPFVICSQMEFERIPGLAGWSHNTVRKGDVELMGIWR